MPGLYRAFIGLSFLGSTSLVPLAANAADLYRAPPPPAAYAPAAVYVEPIIWAGFYAGINGGYGWNSGGNTMSYSNGDSSVRANPQGGFGGGQIGYNFQAGAFVYGIEADFQGANINGRVAGLTANNNVFSNSENVDWFGTVRGRIGYAFGRTLIYGTGGFAYGDVRDRLAAGGALLASNATQTGWTAGGGIEYKLTPAWSLKAEYQYIDLGNEKLSGFDTAGNALTINNLDTNFHTVRLGLNYRFGGGPEPLK